MRAGPLALALLAAVVLADGLPGTLRAASPTPQASPTEAPPAEAMIEVAIAGLAPPAVAGTQWSSRAREDLLEALCAPRTGPVLRFGITTRAPSRWQYQACAAAAGGALTDRIIGRRVLLAVGGETPPPLTAALLYRAVAARVPQAGIALLPNPARSWRDLDPALPDELIQVRLPAEGSAEARILRELVLYHGCLEVAGALLPRTAAARMAVCTTLRRDVTVARPAPGPGVAAWLRGAGPSAIALVGLAEFAAEPELEAALPLDGVSPTFAGIADGSYAPALAVHLLVLQAGAGEAAEAATQVLTDESTIGPAGLLARHGLAALSAAARVQLRVQ